MLVDSFKAFITSGRQHSISFKVGHSQQFHLMAAHLNSLEHHSAIRKSWPNRTITIYIISMKKKEKRGVNWKIWKQVASIRGRESAESQMRSSWMAWCASEPGFRIRVPSTTRSTIWWSCPDRITGKSKFLQVISSWDSYKWQSGRTKSQTWSFSKSFL